VADRLAHPYRAAVERATGLRVAVVASNAGKGLIDLLERRCDAAMASASLEATAAAARSLGAAVDVARLQLHVAAADEVVFVVHPTNPVRRLGWEEIRGMHTGEIVTWKAVGGKETPVTVFTDAAASATRGLIRERVLGGADYASGAVALDAVRQINDAVAAAEGGIGGLGLGFVERDKVRILETDRLERPLGFITLGPPSEDVRRVIAAYREATGSAPARDD
jgi:phosphate transport system substrate-binding protein